MSEIGFSKPISTTFGENLCASKPKLRGWRRLLALITLPFDLWRLARAVSRTESTLSSEQIEEDENQYWPPRYW